MNRRKLAGRIAIADEVGIIVLLASMASIRAAEKLMRKKYGLRFVFPPQYSKGLDSLLIMLADDFVTRIGGSHNLIEESTTIEVIEVFDKKVGSLRAPAPAWYQAEWSRISPGGATEPMGGISYRYSVSGRGHRELQFLAYLSS